MKTPQPPFEFGNSQAVRHWEDAQESKELVESLREKDFIAIPADVAEGLTLKLMTVTEPEDRTPVSGDLMRPLYDLIFDDDLEPRPGLEKIGEAFEELNRQLGQRLQETLEHLE